jgi:hypothetical protein
VATLVARLLATAALSVRIQTYLKIQNGRNKQRSGQQTLDRQKNIQKYNQGSMEAHPEPMVVYLRAVELTLEPWRLNLGP